MFVNDDNGDEYESVYSSDDNGVEYESEYSDLREKEFERMENWETCRCFYFETNEDQVDSEHLMKKFSQPFARLYFINILNGDCGVCGGKVPITIKTLTILSKARSLMLADGADEVGFRLYEYKRMWKKMLECCNTDETYTVSIIVKINDFIKKKFFLIAQCSFDGHFIKSDLFPLIEAFLESFWNSYHQYPIEKSIAYFECLRQLWKSYQGLSVGHDVKIEFVTIDDLQYISSYLAGLLSWNSTKHIAKMRSTNDSSGKLDDDDDDDDDDDADEVEASDESSIYKSSRWNKDYDRERIRRRWFKVAECDGFFDLIPYQYWKYNDQLEYEQAQIRLDKVCGYE